MMTSVDKIRINELVLHALGEDISDQELAEMGQLLHKSSEHADYYKSIIVIYQQLFEHGDIISSAKDNVEDILDKALWASLAENEKVAPAIEVIDKSSQEPLTDVRQRMQELRKEQKSISFNKPLFIITMTSIAALIFMIVFIQMTSRHVVQSVATIRNCSNAQFADNSEINKGVRMTNRSDPYWLQKGLLELEFDYGAALVIEGPAVFRINSAEKICLDAGRAYARVPGSAKGFAIDTPNSTIIDLGTEFGVQVEIDGTSSVHMLKGRASLIPGPKGNTGEFQMLTTGQANLVDLEGNVQNIPLVKNRFVRRIFSGSGMAWRGQNINLADIVSGGNGFGTGRQDYGILINTAEVSDGPLKIDGHGIHDQKSWDGYCMISEIPGIDGIFIPDSSTGPVVVSSGGHVFKDCPDTNSKWCAPITNSTKTTKKDFELRVNDVVYGTPENPAVYLHGNIGITYDLDEIRRSLPSEQTLSRFVSTVVAPKATHGTSLDVWVLIDGQVFFSQTGISGQQTMAVDIALSAQDRFLSLVVTDGVNDKSKNNKNVYDWCFFCRPELVLETN